jgi:aldehyde:ferredoxin oxidoreductase
VLCQFANVPPTTVVELVNAAIDADYDLEGLMQAGDRGWQLKRMVNLRLGLRPSDDRLPGLLRRVLPDGGAAGYDIPVEQMLRAYYAARDWDPGSGWPSDDRLRRLGLSDVAALETAAAI